jgi:ribose transport system substrate-binding protein
MRAFKSLSLLVGLCLTTATPLAHGQSPEGKKSIAVIPKGSTGVYWKSVEAGARDAAKELGVDMVWKGPLKEDDRAQQIAIMEQFISEHKAGIVLAPLDDTALKRPVNSAMASHIPVVIIDSALKGEPGKDFVSFVGTNNAHAGEIGGQALARLLDGKGKVVLLRFEEGSASTTQREEGFLAEIKKHPDIHMLVDNRYGGTTAAEAQTSAMNIIDKIRQADGIFCPNESTTFGMLLALRQNHLIGKVKFIGFDATPQLLEGLKKGEIQALVSQDPRKMGYEGVKTVVAHLNGQQVPLNVDTGVALVTQGNLNTPEIQKLLQ